MMLRLGRRNYRYIGCSGIGTSYWWSDVGLCGSLLDDIPTIRMARHKWDWISDMPRLFQTKTLLRL